MAYPLVTGEKHMADFMSALIHILIHSMLDGWVDDG